MIEIFPNVSDIIRESANLIWNLALNKDNPIDIANFLNEKTNEYREFCTEEEIEFLQFFFNMQMEMMKE